MQKYIIEEVKFIRSRNFLRKDMSFFIKKIYRNILVDTANLPLQEHTYFNRRLNFILFFKKQSKSIYSWIFFFACSAKVLFGNTEDAQLGMQEWDAKENDGNIA